MKPFFRSVGFLSFTLLLLSVNLGHGSVIPGDLHNASQSLNGTGDEDVLELLKFMHTNPRFGHSISGELEAELLTDTIYPQYMKNFLKKISLNANFLELFFKGVESNNCKGHATEWIKRSTEALFQGVGRKELFGPDGKWVLHMFDSWGKPPEGVLTGHVNAYGDFGECVNIDVKGLKIRNTAFKDVSEDFEGRYCTVLMADYASAMTITKEKPVGRPDAKAMIPGENDSMGKGGAVGLGEFLGLMANREGMQITPSIGVCFPNSCERPDIQQMLVNSVAMMYGVADFINSSKPIPYEFDKPETLFWPLTLACYVGKKPDFDAADISVITLISTITALCVIAGVIDFWLNHGVAKPPKRGAAYNYLMAFSLYTNVRKWMSTRKGAEDLGCLHGIRFFSTAWVVLAHTYYVLTFLPQWNMVDVKKVYEDWSVLTVINSTFAVDTFFVLSGMLVGYNILKVLDKTKGKLNIIMLYVHRYLRLTPTYAILIGIMATIIPYLGNGPFWAVMTRWGTLCDDNWWTNLLYVNNFVNTSWLCQGEAWYLANDMQFYIVSPLILYPMWRWEMIGLILLAVYTVLSIACPALMVHFMDTTPTTIPTRDMGKWFTHIYIRPYARIQTFLVGIWLAWLMHKTRGKKVKIPKVVVILGWTLSTAMAPFLLYSIQPWFDPANEIPKVGSLAYAGLSRVGWGLVVSWVIFACIKGYGGLVNSFLSWSPFMPLGRLCYCVYLVSLHLQMILHIRFSQPMRYDSYTQLNFFFAHLLMSFIVGFFATLLFESPFMILQKLIFEGAGGAPRPAPNTANLKRPSKRYGIFYNDEKTVINDIPAEGTSGGGGDGDGTTEKSEKERQD